MGGRLCPRDPHRTSRANQCCTPWASNEAGDLCCGRVPRHLTPVDIRCVHYIASCAPPAAAIRVPAEYFLSSPCSLKSVSRPKFHTLRSAIRPRQAPCSCRLCQRVVREGHLSVLAPNCEVLVMSPFFGFPSYISSETTRTLSVHCTCSRSGCVVGEWDFVWGACTLTLRRIQRMAGLQVWTWAFAPGPPSAVGTC